MLSHVLAPPLVFFSRIERVITNERTYFFFLLFMDRSLNSKFHPSSEWRKIIIAAKEGDDYCCREWAFLLGSYINRSGVKMSERKLNYYINFFFFFWLTEDDWTFLWSAWTDFYSVPRHLVITWKSLRLSIWFFFSFSGGGWIQAKAIFGIECRLLFFCVRFPFGSFSCLFSYEKENEEEKKKEKLSRIREQLNILTYF